MLLTLDVPEDLAEQFRQLPEPKQTEYAIAAIRLVIEEAEERQEILAALKQSLAEAQAGQTFSVEEAQANTHTALADGKQTRQAR